MKAEKAGDVSPKTIRRLILDTAYRAHVGHIGSALSIADIIYVLYFRVLNIKDPSDSQRDRFVLSKGHAALALYAALYLKGWISEEQLASYCQDGSQLGDHPQHGVKGIDFSTGSLGHGLSMGAGAALAARLQAHDRRIFVLLSDAECNEGSLWEAAMFAAHHGLSNLTAILDLNGQQAFGYTKDVMDLSPLSKKWDAFGWTVTEINGHNIEDLERALQKKPAGPGNPQIVLASTTSGKGVSYMERMIKWHYWPMFEQEYHAALADLEAEKA